MTTPANPAPRSPQDIVAALVNLFPKAFTAEGWQPHKPLKIGIDADLIATGCLAKWEVASALRYYCRRRMYCVALAAGGFRHDLNGDIAAEVSAADREWAQTKLAEIDRSQALAIEPPVEQPQRDGLNALRAAAARRQDLRKTSMGPAVEEMSQGPKARDIFDKGPMFPLGGTHGGQENTRAS